MPHIRDIWRAAEKNGETKISQSQDARTYKRTRDKNPETEDLPGFYLDDFFVYGYELPPPSYDIGIESIKIKPDDVPLVVGDEIQILANITNNGEKTVTDLAVTANVTDMAGHYEIISPASDINLEKLSPGISKTVTWTFTPSVGGLYFINVYHNLGSDQNTDNEFVL